VARIACHVSVDILQLPFGCAGGESKVCLTTILAFSLGISLSLCPYIQCNLLKVLRGSAEKGVQLTILCGHDLGKKFGLGRHEMAPLNKTLKNERFSPKLMTTVNVQFLANIILLKTQGLVLDGRV
jgi:hypothetical protein